MRGLHALAMTAALLSVGTGAPAASGLAPGRPQDEPRPFRRDQSIPSMFGGRRWRGGTATPKTPRTAADHAAVASAEAKRARRRERNRRTR